MKTRSYLWAARVAALLFGLSSTAPYLLADGGRKALAKAKPEYPELARKLQLHGIVKVEIVVSPNGQVKQSRALGGHPVLVEAVTRALRDWKFEASSGETTEILEFRFENQ